MDNVLDNKLIEDNMGLVHMVCKRFRSRFIDNPAVDYEDLVSLGTMGLIRALQKFNPEYGTQFSTFAVPTIVGEIRRWLRDHQETVKFSRKAKKDYADIKKANLLDQPPKIIAKILDMDIKRVEAAMNYHNCRYAESFEYIIHHDDGQPITLGDKISTEIDFDSSLEIDLMLSKLTERERKVIRLYYLEELPQSEIGKMIGITQVQVSRILSSIKEKLRGGETMPIHVDGRDYEKARQLAEHSLYTAKQIHKETGVTMATANNYIKKYRVTPEELDRATKAHEKTNEEAPVVTYKLSPQELEKYRGDLEVYKAESFHVPQPIQEEPKVEQENIVEEYILADSHQPINGTVDITLNKLKTGEASMKIQTAIKALQLMGFDEIEISIKGKQIA